MVTRKIMKGISVFASIPCGISMKKDEKGVFGVLGSHINIPVKNQYSEVPHMEGSMPASNHIHINLAKNPGISYCTISIYIYIYFYIHTYMYIYIMHTYHILDIHLYFWERKSSFFNIYLSPIYQITHLEAPAKKLTPVPHANHFQRVNAQLKKTLLHLILQRFADEELFWGEFFGKTSEYSI